MESMAEDRLPIDAMNQPNTMTNHPSAPQAAKQLLSILEMLRDANVAIEPGTKMLGVTAKGAIVLGIMMPSGKLLCYGGIEEDCPWNCEAEAAVTAISKLAELEREIKRL